MSLKNWKNLDFLFENSHFFEDFFGKTALNWELALFSAVWKPHYTGDRTNWNRTNRGIPVYYSKLETMQSYLP